MSVRNIPFSFFFFKPVTSVSLGSNYNNRRVDSDIAIRKAVNLPVASCYHSCERVYT